MNLLKLIRYRFFLFAGMLPYLLGQAIAYRSTEWFNWMFFWVGFVGISLVLIAVELFNEYFDAVEGGDRIFSQQQVSIPHHFYPLGLMALAAAFVIAVYLTLRLGWPILLFSFSGFLGAYFYVGPPIKWAYRGLGETVIGLCYGPLMVLGSFYLQCQKITLAPAYASLINGLSIFCLAVLNEIPDYYQDMLIGKRNLVVRLGKQKAILLLKLGLTVTFGLLVVGTALRIIPVFAIIAVATVPWILKGIHLAEQNQDNPKAFVCAVNSIVTSHVVIALSVSASFLIG